MSDTIDPRHVSRALAMQILFAEMISHQSPPEVADLLEEMEVEEYDKELTSGILKGVRATSEKVDKVITKLAPAWPIDQIAPVDLIILRMGIWEGFMYRGTPAKVVINEMIQLAKEFGGENSGSFVNGVLGNLINKPELQKELSETE
jgi:N utilization substance protein B